MRLMKNCRLCLALILLLLADKHFCFAQAAFRISPPVIELSLGRGGTKVFSFELSNNDSKKQFEFSIFPMDLEMDKTGAMEFLEIGKSEYSCSKWITVEPKTVVIEPGQVKKIVGKLSMPASLSSGGYYSAIVCELKTKSPPKTTTGTTINWRIATLLKVSVTGGKLERKVELLDFSKSRITSEAEDQRKNKGITFIVSLQNQGNIHIAAEGKLTILTPDRKRKGEIDFDVGTGTILPNHIKDFTAVYDRFLPEGEYIARAVFRYGGTSALEKEIPLSVVAGASPQPGKEETVIIPALKVIPEEIHLKIPQGGFRTEGLAIQNQKTESLLIKLSWDKNTDIQKWFKFQPQEVRIEGGKEAKVLLQINIPQEAKEGEYKTNLAMLASLINKEGKEESLEPVNIGITLEIPKF